MDRPNALLTGASGGIGLAIAEALGRAGAHVWLLGRSKERLESARTRVESAGGTATCRAVDLLDPAQVGEACREVLAAGGLDWLIHNAGIAETAAVQSAAADDAQARRAMDVNYHAPRAITQILLPALRAGRDPRVVMVASSAALAGHPYVAAYSASKHALLGWARCAAHDLRKEGVGISVVCPHFVDSPMTEAGAQQVAERTGLDPKQVKDRYASLNPSGALVQPEEVAAPILELLEGPWSGRVLELPGGGTTHVVEAGWELLSQESQESNA